MTVIDHSSHHSHFSFLNGGGQIGQQMRALDWSNTSVGPVVSWPQSLRTTLSILLHSTMPMFLFWADTHVCFYNDAFRLSLSKEGQFMDALGKPGAEVWPERWPLIKTLLDGVLSRDQATHVEDLLMPIYPNGQMDERYWTFHYSPVHDESGKPAGVFVTCSETAEKVLHFKQSQESSNQLAFAIEAAQLATWDLNPITNTFTANARYSEWFGLPAENETDNDLALNVIAEQDRERVIAAYTKALDYSANSQYDIKYSICPEGKPERILWAKGKAWFNEDKIAYRFNGTLQDVTQEVMSRKKLEESEAKLRSIIASAPAGIGLFIGRELIIQHPNQTFIDIIGKGPDIVGKPLREVMPELISEDQPFLQILDEVYTSGEMFQSFGSQVMILKEGVMTDNYYNISYTPLLDAQGKVYAILDIAIDVTEQIKARYQLQESEERFRTMADNMPNLAWMASADGWIYWYNSRWYEYTGTTPAQMEGWGWQSVHDPLMLPQVMQQWKSSIATGKPFEMVFPLKGTDGSLRPFLTRVVPVFNEKDQVIQWFGTNTDIYQQQLIQQQLQALNGELAAMSEELSAANEEIQATNEELSVANHSLSEKNEELMRINTDLDNFIYTASHDLKTPIGNIESLLQALIRTLPAQSLAPERMQRIVTMMGESIERFKRTIANLTEVIKLQKENSGEAVSVNLWKVIEEVSLDLALQLKETRAQLKIEVANCPSLHFSEKNLRSVVYNLLSNAIKYHSPNRVPLVSIHCKRIPAYYVVTVKDNGLGMESGRISQLFTMFKRFHDHVEGTGIGLYMVKKMVENAGGKIEVESKLDEGSSFRVYFPR